MNTCKHCDSLIPYSSPECPNCKAQLNLREKFQGQVKKVLYGISLASISMTLMACYGGPPSKKNDISNQKLEPKKISESKSAELKR